MNKLVWNKLSTLFIQSPRHSCGTG